MARMFGSLIRSAEIACPVATLRSVLQLTAAANRRTVLTGWGIFFDGTSVTAEPVLVQLYRQTTAGTFTGTVTPSQAKPVSDTIQATGNYLATAEPTLGELLDSVECHPQGGFEKVCDFEIAGGGRVAIVVTAPAAVNCIPKLLFEE